MRRVAWTSLLAVIGAGVTFGQTPSGDTIRMRTAGQADRVLTIVKTERMADGHVLVSVKDNATGDTYTLMDPAFASLAKTKDTPVNRPAAEPPPVPKKPDPTTLPLQPAEPTPKALPLQPAITTEPPVLPTKPAESDPTTLPLQPAITTEPPVLPPTKPADPDPTSLPLKPAISAELPLVQTKPADPEPTTLPLKPADPAPASPLTAPLPVAEPAAPSRLPNPVTTPGSTPAVPDQTLPSPTNRGIEVPDLVPVPLQPVSMAPVETIRPYVQSSISAVTPRLGMESPDVRMRREISPWVVELTRAVRPSIRMDAATALAEGRYGWRDEVKAYLVQAATTDPAAVVRAHCISLLSTLGYATAEYRSYLASRSTDRSADVRVAASIALARLEPR